MASDAIYIIRKGQPGYPDLLSHIADPPEQLYCRGNISLLDSFCLGVVGTRKASDYGRQATSDIVGVLAGAGITIVSGLASGIDTAAHRATLDAAGKTIAVFGTGVDDPNIYPKDNLALAHEIIAKDGLLVSEYEPGVHGQPWMFPMRNRIISGLSRGVLVVEADKISGSLITAKQALEQNRDVFAVPGSIYWPRSVGTNLLIQQGAKPVATASDILESYQMRQELLPEMAVSTEDPVQQSILALLHTNGPMHLDAIGAGAGFEIPRVMAAIALLEIKSSIRHQGGGIYRLVA
jgi:DNA processing protein